NGVEVGKVIGRQNLSLNNREIDFHLVEPTSMNRRMHQDQASISFPLAANRSLAAVGRAVVHDQEYPLGVAIPLVVQDLSDEPSERPDPCFRFATTEHNATTHIPSCQILQRSLALILRFDTSRLSRLGWHLRVTPPTSLDAGLLVTGDHAVVGSQ